MLRMRGEGGLCLWRVQRWLNAAVMKVFAFLLFFALAAPASAAPALPWDQDRAALVADENLAMDKLAARVPALEAALRHGARFFPNGAVVGGKQYVLTDGGTEEMLVNLAAAAESKKPGPGQVSLQPVANFYPQIALTLTKYYANASRWADVIRVIDTGLSLSPSPEGAVGAHVATMMDMKGRALVRLKKIDQALDLYRQARTSHVLTDADAIMLARGEAEARGFRTQ